MKEKELDIQTPDGSMTTFVTVPEEHGPHPIILFLMDAPGKREELHDMARRFATAGYYVMLPNLYYRTSKDFVSDFTEASRVIQRGHMNALSNRMVVADCRILIEHASHDKDAGNGPVGCVGYCMSGPFAFAAAAKISDRIKASASIHGVDLCSNAEDSPHLNADKIKGEIYFACAEYDDHIKKTEIKELEDHLKKININYRIEWYPESKHGFVFPQRLGVYHKQSAERHWERMFAMFSRNLKLI
ncbi:MAG: dienelactone hydrolase family protein [Candidatus Azotimanducaceae bacterium]|uniref:Dienelactone hydrolase family protein n=1 Tax=OM182 bacterium TaxID=2510334 RepID=A0A520RWN1_9GAMM|nr:hydrolase [Gammaproteobacteria bacterium]RZO74598.1 MAG: dienelactone hydrolase family protein [OM182 bacterium]